MKLLFSRLFLLAGLSVAIASCSKDKEETAEGITCTIDGTSMTFNANVFALRNDGGGNYSYTVFSSGDMSASPASFVISIGGDAPIATGTYTFGETSGDEQKMGVLTYVPKGTTTDGYISVPGESTVPTKVVVTAVSATSIEGTFEGDLIFLNGTTVSSKTVTNGRFKASVMQ